MNTIILTGVTGGLGEKIAHKILANQELKLIGVYRNEDKFKNLFLEEKITGYRLKESEDFKELQKLISEETEEIILILNSFSIQPLKTIGDYTGEEISMMLDANISQPVAIINSVLSYAKQNGKGLRIINLDSGAADFPLKGWGNYCAAKAYINSFLRVVALENEKIRIVSADPGVMDTDMQKNIRDTAAEVFDKVGDFKRYKEDGRLRAPADVADYIINNYVLNWKASEFREKIRL